MALAARLPRLFGLWHAGEFKPINNTKMTKKFNDPEISKLAQELLGAMEATNKELAKLKAEAKQIKSKYKDK